MTIFSKLGDPTPLSLGAKLIDGQSHYYHARKRYTHYKANGNQAFT